MKKPNQIRGNRKGAAKAAQPKAEENVRLPLPLSRAITAPAKHEKISVSQMAESAIRNELMNVRMADGKIPGELLKSESSIPRDWEEVAALDFTGYLDRDCEERIIYKTPQGDFKAARHSDDEPEVIEDVTRAQVRQWILECTIPEEFAADFRLNATGPSLVLRRSIFDAETELEDAVDTSTALLEAFGCVIELSDKSGNPCMSEKAIEGLHLLAMQTGRRLRGAFEQLYATLQPRIEATK